MTVKMSQKSINIKVTLIFDHNVLHTSWMSYHYTASKRALLIKVTLNEQCPEESMITQCLKVLLAYWFGLE